MRDASNITKKGAAVALAAVTAMSLSVPATALADEAGETGSGTTTSKTTDVEGVLTGTTSGSTAVTTAFTSEYTVTVPESVAMGSSHADTQTASVTVKGKIAAGEQVNVVPATTIAMTSASGESYNLTVTAKNTAWSQTEVTTAGTEKENATISVDGDNWLPGTFTGSLTYTISLGAAAAEAQTFKYTVVDGGTPASPSEFTVDSTADKDATIASLGESGLSATYRTATAVVKADGDYVVIVVSDGGEADAATLDAYTDAALTTRMPSTTTVGDIKEIYVGTASQSS